jgi:hypothetical protein
MSTNAKSPMPPSPQDRRGWMRLIAWSSVVWIAGCTLRPARVVVIPSDRQIQFLPANQPLDRHPDLYLVPPARMQEILQALNPPPP